QLKLQVKLDKGFEDGTYCVYLEYDGLAADKGFRSAHKTATAFAALLQEQLGQFDGYAVGAIEDASRSGDPRRKRDLECTFLAVPLAYADGAFHDREITERFRVALLRAGQAWEQAQAGVHARRSHARQGKFRQQLEELLGGEAYARIDAATKERLAEEVTRLAFPARGLEF
ncbi:MAG: hypothetical protein L0Z62_07825, partial [Gemmataceae bacterium]|nr:hypothetical protein [Gemmataceae bacterium]